ncbi:hypothetical protein Mapa_001542 [Marchantia paleacea]|nr:hypothetical protein Mapa_001542 [Marchantia paleacea]
MKAQVVLRNSSVKVKNYFLPPKEGISKGPQTSACKSSNLLVARCLLCLEK